MKNGRTNELVENLRVGGAFSRCGLLLSVHVLTLGGTSSAGAKPWGEGLCWGWECAADADDDGDGDEDGG